MRKKVSDDEVLLEQLKALGPAATFPSHAQQRVVLRAATDIIAAIGGNRCQAAGSRVLTARGLVPVEEIVVGDEVIGPHGVRQPVVATYVSPAPEPIYRVRTKRGYRVEVSAEHPLWVQDAAAPAWQGGVVPKPGTGRFVEARHLEVGQFVKLGMRVGRNDRGVASDTISEDDAYFLGLMTGDGWWAHETTGRMSLASDAQDMDRVEWAERYLAAQGVTTRREQRSANGWQLVWCDIAFKRRLAEWGVALETGESKRIPECVWRGSDRVIAAFLAGLFDSDGCATTKPSAVLVGTNEAVLRGAHTLLLRLGVVGSLHERPAEPRHRRLQPSWRLELAGVKAGHFRDRVGFRSARKQARLAGVRAAPISTKYDRIVAVEVVREAHVYGFTCPPTHTFYSDGLFHHNSGKSKVGELVLSRLVRREGPVWKRLRWSPEHLAAGKRPLEIWVAPQTDEKAKSLWEPRLLNAFAGLPGMRYVQSPHRYFEWQDELGGGKVWLKSQEQGFTAFESNDVDFVLFDEEPLDRRVYASAKMRLSTTNGVCMLTFTPLSGMTWTFDELFAPIAEKVEYQIGDRAWRRGNELTVVQMGMADNPEAVAGGGVARLLADTGMTEAEKAARLYGTYGFTEGLLIPQFAALKTDQESIFLLERLPDDRPYRWVLTADPNKRHGALLTALDPDGNRYYCAEHYAEGLPDSEHAKAYRAMIAQFRRWGCSEDTLEAFADPGGAGSQAIINLAETGFYAAPIPKDPGSVSASIKRLRRAAHIDPRHEHPVTKKPGAPHVYFLRSLESLWKSGGTHYRESRLLWEFRQYRQKDNAAPDTPVKRFDDLVDCARYVELAHPEGPQPFSEDFEAKARAKLDPLSRQEHDRFDRMVEKLQRNPSLAKLGLA